MPRDLNRIVAELKKLIDQQRRILTGALNEESAAEYVLGARRVRQRFADLEASLAHESAEKGFELPVDLAVPYRRPSTRTRP